MKRILLALAISLALFNYSFTSNAPLGIGLDMIQRSNSITLSATFGGEITYSLINENDETVLVDSFFAPGEETFNTETYNTGFYTLSCVYSTGSDVFSVYIDNE